MAVGRPAFAQTIVDAPEPDAAATTRLGPLALKSRFALTNLGTDSNVFNQWVDPVSDLTMTLTPVTDAWLRFGKTWLTGTARVDWVYFNRYRSERSANTNYRVGIVRAQSRVRVTANASRKSTRDRPSFEIDVRSQSYQKSFDMEAAVRALTRTYLGVKGSHQTITFERDAEFFGVNLARELARVLTSEAVFVKHGLSPLTYVTLEVGRDGGRFPYVLGKDGYSTRYQTSVEFRPGALISGSAMFGYKHFSPVSREIPEYRGPITQAALSYKMPNGTTVIGGVVSQDLVYSYNPSQPYYLQTMSAGNLSQQIAGPLDVTARYERQRLAYRDRIDSAVRPSPSVGYIRQIGIGAGYRLGSDKRLGFTVDRVTRTSTTSLTPYKGLKIGMSLTYDR
jgi:hypothetical protein